MLERLSANLSGVINQEGQSQYGPSTDVQLASRAVPASGSAVQPLRDGHENHRHRLQLAFCSDEMMWASFEAPSRPGTGTLRELWPFSSASEKAATSPSRVFQQRKRQLSEVLRLPPSHPPVPGFPLTSLSTAILARINRAKLFPLSPGRSAQN